MPSIATQESPEEIALKVAAILAVSANEPGLNEIQKLIEMTESVRQVEQAYSDMIVPFFMAQTSHVHV